MSTPLFLRLRGEVIGRWPLLMGIVNATPDSFSDAGDHPDLEARSRASSCSRRAPT